MWQWLESQVCERNNETASLLRFNKPESANFIFDCVQYFIPKEGRSRLLRTSASVAFPPPGALGGSQQMRECTGLHANPPWLDIDFFFLFFPGTTENLCSSFPHSFKDSWVLTVGGDRELVVVRFSRRATVTKTPLFKIFNILTLNPHYGCKKGKKEAVKSVKRLDSYLHMNECIVWLECFR